jgi:hypothetical protein
MPLSNEWIRPTPGDLDDLGKDLRNDRLDDDVDRRRAERVRLDDRVLGDRPGDQRDAERQGRGDAECDQGDLEGVAGHAEHDHEQRDHRGRWDLRDRGDHR